MLLVSSSVCFCPFIFIKTIQIFLYNDLNKNSIQIMSPQNTTAGEGGGDYKKLDTSITRVFYGEEATNKSLEVFSNIKDKFDACGDPISPSVCMGFEPLKASIS